MHQHQEMVLEFHKAFGCTANDHWTIPSDKDKALRCSLVMEESAELTDAVLEGSLASTTAVHAITPPLVHTADACADLLYVVYGTAITYGIKLGVPGADCRYCENPYCENCPAMLPTEFPVRHARRLIGYLMRENNSLAEASLLAGSSVEQAESIARIYGALSNLAYEAYEVALACGVDIDMVFKEVHRSNMSKLMPDGTVKRRDDGKVLKPPTYSPADIAGTITNQYALAGCRLHVVE